jgi:hypothetical protein
LLFAIFIIFFDDYSLHPDGNNLLGLFIAKATVIDFSIIDHPLASGLSSLAFSLLTFASCPLTFPLDS